MKYKISLDTSMIVPNLTENDKLFYKMPSLTYYCLLLTIQALNIFFYYGGDNVKGRWFVFTFNFGFQYIFIS